MMPALDTPPDGMDLWLLDDQYEMLSDAGIPFEWIIKGNTAAWLPTIPEDAPDELREAIARRRLVVLEQRCPCGIKWRPDYRPGEVSMGWIIHREHCPALTKRLRRALRKWRP